jgi:hypothetical protein
VGRILTTSSGNKDIKAETKDAVKKVEGKTEPAVEEAKGAVKSLASK